MNEDLEGVLVGLTPRGAPPGLRPHVLAAVDERLQAPAVSPSARRWALAAAALLLVSVGLNVWVNRVHERRLARILGPLPISRPAAEIAAQIAQVAGAQTGQWVYQRLALRRVSEADPAQYYAAVEQVMNDLRRDFEEKHHEQGQETSEMDRHRPEHPGGDTSDGQRLLRLEHRRTA